MKFNQGDIVKSKSRTKEFPLFIIVTWDKDSDVSGHFEGVSILETSDWHPAEEYANNWNHDNFELTDWTKIKIGDFFNSSDCKYDSHARAVNIEFLHLFSSLNLLDETVDIINSRGKVFKDWNSKNGYRLTEFWFDEVSQFKVISECPHGERVFRQGGHKPIIQPTK